MQYAVLHHTDFEEPHYDLLVEMASGSDLSTWRLKEWPVEREAEATKLKDHRRFYLTYEGEIPGHRGRVDRVACGECDLEDASDGSLAISVRSGGPSCRLRLWKTGGDSWRVCSG